MATLTALKLVAAKKPTQANPVQHRRNKLSIKVLEQLALAKARKDGQTYAPTRIKTITNSDGDRVQVTRAKNVRQWWFVDNNKVLLQVRYGAKVLALNGKSNAVECANADALISALETVNAAVLAGELDTQIEAVSGQIRGGFQR